MDLVYKEWLAKSDPGLWEQSYLDFVTKGLVSIDDWIFQWLWERITIPASEDYSIFSPHVMIDDALMGVKVHVQSFHKKKNRLLRFSLSQSGSLYPDFEYTHLPDKQNIRFESVGNPFIDTPNYRCWEEYLFFKLFSEILLLHGGLDAFVELIHQHR